ncbi:MAG: NAD(+)/NADH kinase [Firmicutes bacterium]|nr:NAD(+)/NADH kinase [Bacillota bacterium]
MGKKSAKNRSILIYCSNTDNSKQVEKDLRKKLELAGFNVETDFADKKDDNLTLTDDVELIICIGGDGTFLRAVHYFGFPNVPFIGVNTGHLGFFQEIMPDQLDLLIDNYIKEKYTLQKMQTVKAIVNHDDVVEEFTGLNEFIVKGEDNYSVHLNISIGGGFIEKFSGDGILISTPAGSTAYNYSLGGSLVDPRIKLIQVTPIAPMNTTAYRSLTSPLLLPPDLALGIVPDEGGSKGRMAIAFDGFGRTFDKLDSIEVMLSEVTVNLMRFESYDFWAKVKSKFI